MTLEILRSARKTLQLEIVPPDLHLRVRAPLNCPDSEVRRFVDSHAEWVRVHTRRLREKLAEPAPPPLSPQQLQALKARAQAYLPGRVCLYAQALGVSYGRISIRSQKTRWGSCSARGHLSFNCLLMLMPPDIIDYVVVHELCHRREMNHSPRFYALLGSLVPDWRQRGQWIKENGALIMRRLKNETKEDAL